jgi:hypothetical protein
MTTSDHVEIEAHVFDRSTCFLPTTIASVKGIYPIFAGRLHILESEKVPSLPAVMLRIYTSTLQFHVQENYISELPITG